MDWSFAISQNQALLTRFLTMLIGMAGFCDGEGSRRLPHALYWRIMRLLRPAESALRRLIVVAAREIEIAPRTPRSVAGASVPAATEHTARRVACFPLFDARLRPGAEALRLVRTEPRIRGFDGFEVFDHPALASDMIDAAALDMRIARFRRALQDVPREARRLARRRNAARIKRPMRPGRPPGHREKPLHGIDFVLLELHKLALLACAPPGGSTPGLRV